MNKKKWIILVIVLVAIIGGLVGYLAGPGSQSDEEKLINYTEGSDKYTGLSESVVVAYDVLKGETELKYTINQGALELGSLEMGISLLNKSQRTIKQTEVVRKILDDKGKVLLENYIAFMDLGPGQTKKGQFPWTNLKKLDGEAKKITLTLWKTWGEAAPTSTTTTSPTVTPKTTPSTILGPEETVLKFFKLLKENQYTEAKNLISPECVPDYLKFWSEGVGKNYTSLEDAWRDNQELMPQKAEIISASELEKEEPTLEVRLTFSNKQIEKLDVRVTKKSGSWKLILP